MLNDTEKERIRLEERYRREVVDQLSVPKSSSGGLWTFLNSSFGGWLLSLIFISCIGTLLTTYHDNRTTSRENQKAIERLDFEIGYRFSQIQARLYDAYQSANDRDSKIQVALQGLKMPPSGEYQHLFPEYSGFSLPSLVAELWRREDKPEMREKVEPILAHLSGIHIFFETRKTSLSDPKQIASAIIDDLVLERWRDTRWYFLDGTKEDPFP